MGERHLCHALLSYMKYYNEVRTHLSLEKDAPVSRPIERAGHILCRPVLGGLHHQYVRILLTIETTITFGIRFSIHTMRGDPCDLLTKHMLAIAKAGFKQQIATVANFRFKTFLSEFLVGMVNQLVSMANS